MNIRGNNNGLIFSYVMLMLFFHDVFFTEKSSASVVVENHKPNTVLIKPETNLDSMMCSGIFISEKTILTAAHCMDRSVQYYHISIDTETNRKFAFRAKILSIHPTLDASLLVVIPKDSDDDPSKVVSKELIYPPINSAREGDKVILHGYGFRAGKGIGHLSKIKGMLIKVRDRSILFRSNTEIGPCSGDSGAPVFSNNSIGRPKLLGILIAGSESCSGPDKLLPIHLLRPWIKEFDMSHYSRVSQKIGRLNRTIKKADKLAKRFNRKLQDLTQKQLNNSCIAIETYQNRKTPVYSVYLF